jgi:hypothetical protein
MAADGERRYRRGLPAGWAGMAAYYASKAYVPSGV